MIHIFGHQNPDTDSVCSAMALSRLKNLQGETTRAYALGELSRETRYVLDRFGVEAPDLLEDIKTEVRDLSYDLLPSVQRNTSLLKAFRIMEREHIKILPVCDAEERLTGIVTMQDIAMGLIHGEERRLVTHTDHLLEDLNGRMLVGSPKELDGKVIVMAFFHRTVRRDIPLGPEWISIVGDNYDNIALCIQAGVQLVVITGGHELPEPLIRAAEERGVTVISVSPDTYMTSKKIDQCNYLDAFMPSGQIDAIREYEYLEDVYKMIRKRRHSFYPVLGKGEKYLGFIGRTQLMHPQRKQVIMVDHNEYAQSAPGIEEAEILEVVDHHRIGSIRTAMPIAFRNMPVGSTCTIVTRLFQEAGLSWDEATAGLLLSGIISDTLHFKSPTTTALDRQAAADLNRTLALDLEDFAREMFRVGTSLKGMTIDEIVHQDAKTFDTDDGILAVSQVFTLDIDHILEMQEELMAYLNRLHQESGNMMTLLVVTDILREGSTLFYVTEEEMLLAEAFGMPAGQGMFVEQTVSRKKQVVPKIVEAQGRLGSGA